MDHIRPNSNRTDSRHAPPTLVVDGTHAVTPEERQHPAVSTPTTPPRRRSSRAEVRATAPHMDQCNRVPVAGAMSALRWPAGDVFARVVGPILVVTRRPQPYATRVSIDSRARLVISPAGRSALAVSAGALLLVVTVTATDLEPEHLIVCSLHAVASDFLSTQVAQHG